MESNNAKAQDKTLWNVIRTDDEAIQDHLGKNLQGSVEDTLNTLLDAEAERLCDVDRYNRTDTWTGS